MQIINDLKLTNVLLKSFIQMPIGKDLVEVYSPILYFGKLKRNQRSIPISFTEENSEKAIEFLNEIRQLEGKKHDAVVNLIAPLIKKYKPFSTKP